MDVARLFVRRRCQASVDLSKKSEISRRHSRNRWDILEGPGTLLNASRPRFLIANVAEYKQADRRRQISLLARRVDLCNLLRHRRTLGLRDILQPAP